MKWCRTKHIADERLVEFVDSAADIAEFRDDPKLCAQIKNFINRHKKEYGGGIGNWQRAESIHQFVLDGLHCGLRIATHTMKYTLLFSLGYYEFIFQPENDDLRNINHANAMEFVQLDTQQILKHFKECCSIQFHYDENCPSNTKIHSRKFIYFIVCMLK